MSSRVFSNLTAALLAMHTVLGCCWHHAHACSPECERSASVEESHEEGHGAAGCESGHSDCEQHHGTHVCQKGTCVFVGPAKVRVSPTTDWSVSAWAFVATGESSLPASSRPGYGDDSERPSLRLHLAHQVLLL